VANLWAAGPALGTARHRHATVRLGDGRAVVVGGLTGTAAAPVTLASAEAYDPVSGTWSPLAALHTARAGHSATVLPDGRVLVAGGTGARGSTGTTALASTEVFDPATGAWTAAAPMTETRTGHQAVLLRDGRVLVIGGTVATGGPPAALAYCELFDPAAGSWTPTGDLGTGRTGHQATLLPDGTVLVTGGDAVGRRPDGRYDARSLDTAERYNPATGTWTAAARMPGPRTRHRGILLRTGQVLLTGGTSGPTFTAGYRTAVTYDPGADSWTGTGALARGRWAYAVAELSDGRIVVAGGIAAGGLAAAGPGAALTTSTEIFTP
jgi:N-acetylneuraminic acid mutarotase